MFHKKQKTNLLGVDEDYFEPRQQKRDGDARAHRAGADDPYRLHLGRLARRAGNSERRALRQKEVPPGTGLL